MGESTRREFLQQAALAAASVSSFAQEATRKETLDALLKKNREHEKFTAPARNNHVPMTLVALYRMGGTAKQMQRYADGLDLSAGTEVGRKAKITKETWKAQLGRGAFSSYIELFDGWIEESSIEAVLKEAVPLLMKGSSSVAYHSLLRLGYAVDYGGREETAYALAFWASGYYPGPDVVEGEAVEPGDLLAEFVKCGVRLRQTGRIDRNIRQVYETKEFAKLWRPVKLPDAKPLDRIAELIRESFTTSQHFTLLHALTSCQALRLLLPYLNEPRECLGRYWHSVCAAYLTITSGRFEAGKDSAPDGGAEWNDVLAKAAETENALEHTAKLTYSCWLESQHYKTETYRALASRELKKPSVFG